MSDTIGGISLDDIMAAAMDGFDDLDKDSVIEDKTEDVVKDKIENKTDSESEASDKLEKKSDIKKDVESTDMSNVDLNVYDYDLNTFILNADALNLLAKSYNDLKNDVSEKLWFESAVKAMAFELFPKAITYECESQIKCSVKVDTGLLDLFTYGQYSKYLESKSDAFKTVFETCSLRSLNNVLEYPIEVNSEKPFAFYIKTDAKTRSKAESFIQFIIYTLADKEKKGDILFRCVDGKKSGQSYGRFISLINSNKIFGNGIYSDEQSVADLTKELNQIAENNVIKLKGQYSSVYEYNEKENKKIPLTLTVFCDTEGFSYYRTDDEIRNLVSNSENSGINTIFLTEDFSDTETSILKNVINFEFCDGKAFVVSAQKRVELDIDHAVFTLNQYEKLEEKLNTVVKVDTDFKSHYDIDNLALFTRDATDGLQIPFAFDEDNRFVDLEIGDATPHALLSGATGSGKSVTLHAIINQIMINYHPDDVEIWAIDYKAVEFGYYVNKRTPHITVIGQDNSEDFTFGLIDLIKKEYDRRKNLFVENNVKDFKAYRMKFGKRSISRILIVIDEFHNMTQAIAGYMGEKDYKNILENLLSEMRAMGMSFLFCSQTIAAGLNGLTEKGRNQIGCRLSMKHEDITEIKETLSLSISSGVDFESIKYLRQGELIYKKISNKDGEPPYTLERVNVLFTESYRDQIIDLINNHIEPDYIAREETICKNSNRYDVLEKKRHPITKFMSGAADNENEYLVVYPGAPTSLSDYLSINLNEEAGNNILLIGENDSMRESIVISSILGMLIDSQNKVVVSILDENDSDNQRLYHYLRKIKSDRLELNYGYDDVMRCIGSLKKITPYSNGRIIYFWYGLNKLKNLIFLNSQEEEENKTTDFGDSDGIPEGMDPLDFLNNALASIGIDSETEPIKQKFSENLTYKDCQTIMSNLEEYGSENGRFCFMIFNTLKGMKKTKISSIDNYEYRIALKMSTDDSYDLFGSTMFISRANETTAVLYTGSKVAKTVRPYIIPDNDFIEKFNERLGNIHGSN